MFEKEAKERAEEIEAKQTLGVYDNDEDLARDEGWNDGYVSGYEEGFQNGAEYGYNKAKEEMQAQIEKMKLCQNCKFADNDFMEEPCRNCSRCLGEDIKREGTSDKWEIKEK